MPEVLSELLAIGWRLDEQLELLEPEPASDTYIQMVRV